MLDPSLVSGAATGGISASATDAHVTIGTFTDAGGGTYTASVSATYPGSFAITATYGRVSGHLWWARVSVGRRRQRGVQDRAGCRADHRSCCARRRCGLGNGRVRRLQAGSPKRCCARGLRGLPVDHECDHCGQDGIGGARCTAAGFVAQRKQQKLSTDLVAGRADQLNRSQSGSVRTSRPWVLPTEPRSRGDLLASGVSDAMIRSQIANGRLVRVAQGVFLAAASWPVEREAQFVMQARAEQARHPESVISHASAAAIWGLPRPGFGSWHDDRVSLTRASGSRPHRPGAVHHQGVLPAAQVGRDPAGYQVTTPVRTAVDLAVGIPLPQALVLLDAAARLACSGFVSQPRRRDFGNPALAKAARELLMEAAETVRRPSLRPSISLAEPARESPIESLSAGYFELAGLPRPLFQEPVRTRLGIFFPDCLWPEHQLIGEADGAEKYNTPAASVAEKEREQAFRDQGWRVVRWLGKEIMARPQTVVDRVSRQLAVPF